MFAIRRQRAKADGTGGHVYIPLPTARLPAEVDVATIPPRSQQPRQHPAPSQHQAQRSQQRHGPQPTATLLQPGQQRQHPAAVGVGASHGRDLSSRMQSTRSVKCLDELGLEVKAMVDGRTISQEDAAALRGVFSNQRAYLSRTAPSQQQAPRAPQFCVGCGGQQEPAGPNGAAKFCPTCGLKTPPLLWTQDEEQSELYTDEMPLYEDESLGPVPTGF